LSWLLYYYYYTVGIWIGLGQPEADSGHVAAVERLRLSVFIIQCGRERGAGQWTACAPGGSMQG